VNQCRVLSGNPECLTGVSGIEDDIVTGFEDVADQGADIVLIVDHQNGFHAVPSSLSFQRKPSGWLGWIARPCFEFR